MPMILKTLGVFNTLIYNFAVFAIRVKSQIKSFISSEKYLSVISDVKLQNFSS